MQLKASGVAPLAPLDASLAMILPSATLAAANVLAAPSVAASNRLSLSVVSMMPAAVPAASGTTSAVILSEIASRESVVQLKVSGVAPLAPLDASFAIIDPSATLAAARLLARVVGR